MGEGQETPPEVPELPSQVVLRILRATLTRAGTHEAHGHTAAAFTGRKYQDPTRSSKGWTGGADMPPADVVVGLLMAFPELDANELIHGRVKRLEGRMADLEADNARQHALFLGLIQEIASKAGVPLSIAERLRQSNDPAMQQLLLSLGLAG